jgi:hypothetical protein
LHSPAPSVLTYAPAVSNATAFVLKKMLEREADGRFQSYGELIESLQFARNELGTKPAAKARVVVDSEQQSSAGMWVTLASIGVLVIGCITGYFLMRNTDAPKVAAGPAPEVETPAVVEKPKPKVEPAQPVQAVTTTNTSAPAPGVYLLVNRKNNKALDCANSTMTNGGELRLGGVTKAPNQRWMVKNSADGTSRLLAFHNCKALDVRNGSKDDSAIISTWAPINAPPQRWSFREIEPGWYAIFSVSSNKALTLVSSGPSGDGQVGQRNYSGSPEQQWRLESLGALPAGIDTLDPVLTPVLPAASPVTARSLTSSSPRYVQMDLEPVLTGDSRKGLYSNPDEKNSPQPQLRGLVEISGVPFTILDPAKTSNGKDNITLRGGRGNSKTAYPTKVEVAGGNVSLSRLHFVGGVSGWGFPWQPPDNPLGAIAARITVRHQGGGTQEIILRNAYEIMDHTVPTSGQTNVPGSSRIEGFANPRKQIRYFSKPILDGRPVEKIVIESFDNHLAPTFFALTGEKK